MLDQAPILPAEPLQPETQPENQPIDLEAQGRRLAEDHRRQAQEPSNVRVGSAMLLSTRLPRFTSILKEAAGRLQAQTSKAG